MNAEDAGLVTVTFNPETVGAVTQTKTGPRGQQGARRRRPTTSAFDNVVDSPGVAFSLPGGSSVTVPAGETRRARRADDGHARGWTIRATPSLFPTQGVQANYGDQPRNFLTEEGSYLTFSQSATLKFRLPVYMAERPASTMSAPPTIVTGGAGTGSTTIPLSGADICTGTLAAGPTCTGSFPTDVESLVSPFELQVVSPLDPVNSTDYADIHYVGTAFLPGAGSPSLANDLIMFGIASWGDWSTPNDVGFNICVDTQRGRRLRQDRLQFPPWDLRGRRFRERQLRPHRPGCPDHQQLDPRFGVVRQPGRPERHRHGSPPQQRDGPRCLADHARLHQHRRHHVPVQGRVVPGDQPQLRAYGHRRPLLAGRRRVLRSGRRTVLLQLGRPGPQLQRRLPR